VVKRVMINEEMLKALLEGRVKLRKDVKLKYGKYRVVRRYVRVGVEGGSEGKGKIDQ
jgi:uncharacterized protein YaiL (DUF2058 family)